MSDLQEDPAIRAKALVGLVFALAVGVAGWIGLERATDRGIARLATIDSARAQCTQLWAAARTASETLSVDRVALTDTIDPMSDDALVRCGQLRDPGPATTRPNNREMSGEPMPRGLR